MSLTKQIQPALFNGSHEFFSVGIDKRKLCNGLSESIHILSHNFTVLLADELRKDLKAQKSLTKLGLTKESDRIQKFYECNYSAFDAHPDITEDGELGPREYVQCAMREGACPFENKLCRNPMNLTNRETQVAKRIARGHMDIEICSELFMSGHTLRNHKNKIESKIGRKGKPAIASWVENYLG